MGRASFLLLHLFFLKSAALRGGSYATLVTAVPFIGFCSIGEEEHLPLAIGVLTLLIDFNTRLHIKDGEVTD